MTLQDATQELIWRAVPQRAIALAEKCADVTLKARQAVAMEDQDGFLDLWYNPDSDTLKLNVGDWIDGDTLNRWKSALAPLAAKLEVVDEAGGPGSGNWDAVAGRPTLSEKYSWVKIAERPPEARAFLEKQAVSPTLSAMATGIGYKPNVLLHGPKGNPNPLTTLLAGGLLGTGAGYGLGFMAEQLLPDQWERGKLRRTGAILGGALGAAPGAAWMGANAYNDQSLLQGHPRTPPLPQNAEQIAKTASQSGYDGVWPTIHVPGITHALWEDPRVRDRVPVQSRAALTGLVEGASAMRDGADYISPLDVARLAAGMGVGYASGAIAGKLLGALSGAPVQTQELLKNTGMYAGLVNQVLPMLF
jgi:hypothetical protein